MGSSRVPNPEYTVLRIDVNGDWTVPELCGLLQGTNDAYSRLNTADFFGRAAQSERGSNKAGENWSWQEHAYYTYVFSRTLRGGRLPGERSGELERGVARSEAFHSLVATALQCVGPLRVKAIQYSSPGCLEMIGSYNPLKALADAFSGWYKIKTEGEKNRLDAQIAAMKIEFHLRSEILRAIKPALREAEPEYVEAFVRFVIEGTHTMVLSLATDTRIRKLSLVGSESPHAVVGDYGTK